jgi:hypothetical protein
MLWSWLKFAILAALIRKCGYERITQQIHFKIILVLLFENPAQAHVHVHFLLDKHSTFQEARSTASKTMACTAAASAGSIRVV